MIGIATVLAKIDLSATEGTFSITFIKEDGSVRTYKRAQKGHKRAWHTTEAKQTPFHYNIKTKGVVLVAVLDEAEVKFRTIKISSIIKFNDQIVHH